MIITKMVLHSAITGLQSDLVTIKIVDDGTGTASRGNYYWIIYSKKSWPILKDGEIKNWPRKSRTAIALLQRVINDAYPPKVKK